MSNYRLVEVKRGEKWEPIEFRDVKKGDTFRAFEDDEKTIPSTFAGNTEFLAKTDAMIGNNAIWFIRVITE